MQEFWNCTVCGSMITGNMVDGECRVCGLRTCSYCTRRCDRCQQIFCMLHVESKVVMRQQMPFIHRLCSFCRKIW